MPIYEYRCPACGAEFEKMQKISAPPPPCPACAHADVVKKVSASAFVLKGSGWYKDHYGLKKSSSDSSSEGSQKSGAPSGESGASSSSAPSTASPATSSSES